MEEKEMKFWSKHQMQLFHPQIHEEKKNKIHISQREKKKKIQNSIFY